MTVADDGDSVGGYAFISYVREDSAAVDRLQRMLELAGVRVWRDTADLWPGEDWRAKIRHAITDDALVFIACFSSSSLNRRKSYQNEELTLAIEQLRLRKPGEPWLIPVRFDDCDIPEFDVGAGRALSSFQRADLFGEHFDAAAARLVTSVARILRRHSAGSDPIVTELRPLSRWSMINVRPPAAKTHATSPKRDHPGKIVTFYSYKGGVGKTMALANIACILAANGLKVLVADWDLEAPGLHGFLRPFMGAEAVLRPGVIDLIRDYEWQAAKSAEQEKESNAEHACVERFASLLNWELPGSDGLYFMSAGYQNRDYAASLSSLDWDHFYDRLKGGEFLDAVAADMRSHYDYTLIDSPSGLSDIADIVTVQFPDVLVDCFSLHMQSLEGSAQVARRIKDRYSFRDIRVLPVPMRVEDAEKQLIDERRKTVRIMFSDFPEMTDMRRAEYWGAVEVPYQPFYSYSDRRKHSRQAACFSYA